MVFRGRVDRGRRQADNTGDVDSDYSTDNNRGDDAAADPAHDDVDADHRPSGHAKWKRPL
ncbi:hypothetical protein [Haladaptatus sp. DFWS20]|uniref:hypothetical protein n=1 Tax=Haladaptatus sp. DFWS20 TaxID=3403467 RepID=UPI003EBB6844